MPTHFETTFYRYAGRHEKAQDRSAAPMTEAGPILVVGKSGRVARDLVDTAGRLGFHVIALGRPALDLEDRDSIDRVLARQAPLAIVNTAAQVVLEDAERNPAQAFAVNCDGAAHIAAAAAAHGIPLLHLSTDYVFDGAKGAPYGEDDPTAPLSVYGRSKAAGEEAVLAAHPGALVVRTSWVFCAHGTNFLTTMLHLAETQDVVRVVADQRGTPTAGDDLAHALLEMVRQLLARPREIGGGIYHVAGSGETTWLGVAQAIFDGWAQRGHRVPAVQAISTADWPGAACRPRDSRLDCGKLVRRFGIRLPDWRDSLARCLERLAHERQARPVPIDGGDGRP